MQELTPRNPGHSRPKLKEEVNVPEEALLGQALFRPGQVSYCHASHQGRLASASASEIEGAEQAAAGPAVGQVLDTLRGSADQSELLHALVDTMELIDARDPGLYRRISEVVDALADLIDVTEHNSAQAYLGGSSSCKLPSNYPVAYLAVLTANRIGENRQLADLIDPSIRQALFEKLATLKVEDFVLVKAAERASLRLNPSS